MNKKANEIADKHGCNSWESDRGYVLSAMEEYAKEVAIKFGKRLGLIGTSWRGTPDSEQWEYLTKSNELEYSSTENLYNEFIKRTE